MLNMSTLLRINAIYPSTDSPEATMTNETP